MDILLAKGFREVTIMCDDEDTAFEHLEGFYEGSKRLTIEIVYIKLVKTLHLCR
jgi:hypothetical protein